MAGRGLEKGRDVGLWEGRGLKRCSLFSSRRVFFARF